MTGEELMLQMGFPESECGHFVSKLRLLMNQKAEQGTSRVSGGTWADECYERDDNGFIVGYKISHEERARSFLEMWWAIDHGHSHQVEIVDGFRWRNFLSCLRDKMREAAMHWRIRRSGQNPYSTSTNKHNPCKQPAPF